MNTRLEELSDFVLSKNRKSEEILFEQKNIKKRYFEYQNSIQKEDPLFLKDDLTLLCKEKNITDDELIINLLLEIINEYMAIYAFPTLTNMLNEFYRIIYLADEFYVFKYDISNYLVVDDLLLELVTEDKSLEAVLNKNNVDFFNLNITNTFKENYVHSNEEEISLISNIINDLIMTKIKILNIEAIFNMYNMPSEKEKHKLCLNKSYMLNYKSVYSTIDDLVDFCYEKYINNVVFFMCVFIDSGSMLYTKKHFDDIFLDEELGTIEDKKKELGDLIKYMFLAENELSIYISEEKELFAIGDNCNKFYYVDEIKLYNEEPMVERSEELDFSYINHDKNFEIYEIEDKNELKKYRRMNILNIK